MSLFKTIFKPKIFAAAVVMAIVSLVGIGAVGRNAADAASCETNNIVHCGYTSPTDLASKIAGSKELQDIYNHDFTSGYGIGSASEFKANAKHVTVYKDGRVVLDNGTVVATDANSLGREKFGSNRKAISIAGETYYYSPTNDSFASNSLGGYALIGEDHSLQFAALTACGNPVWGTSPGYECKMLNQEKVNDTTYNYSATVSYKHATLAKLVYQFDDGQSKTVTSNFTQKVSHTYTPGKHTTKVTAYFNVNGKEVSDTSVSCTKTIEVPQPPKPPKPVFVCSILQATQISRTEYKFTVVGKSQNASFISASFDFDDNQKASNLKGSGEVVTTTHNYAKEGKYTITAILTYKEGTTQVSKACSFTVNINGQTCAEKPNAPECQPPVTPTCENTPSMPGCQPTPQAPQVLPSTGPTEILGSAFGLSSVAGAGMYYRSSRRNFLSQIFKS